MIGSSMRLWTRIQGSIALRWRTAFWYEHFHHTISWRDYTQGIRTASTTAKMMSRQHHAVDHQRSGFLPSPTVEQQVAIDTLLNTKNNLIIDAMAGSGKTTTILLLAQAAPTTNFLVLVYNRRLMLETQVRATALGLLNVTIFNYHTLGARYYTAESSTDQGLKRIVEDDMSVVHGQQLPDFSVLVMDEQQDLTPILKRFVDKIIRDKRHTQNNPINDDDLLRVVVLGDWRQEIYSFNNADSRFLTMASALEVFGYVNNKPWTAAHQTFSNRVTIQNAKFINEHLLKANASRPMRAMRQFYPDGEPYPRPRYVICEPMTGVLGEVERLLTEHNLNPSDIIILAPSTRGISAAKHIANSLALKDIPVLRADSDLADLPPETAAGRVLVCTYHQAKGIERRAAIVLGFDQSYHTLFDKMYEISSVSNAQYVAATRAIEHLVLVQDHKWASLPFIDMDNIDQTCDLIELLPLASKVRTMNTRRKPATQFGVVALCRNLSETLLTECLNKLNIMQTVKPAFPPPRPPIGVLDKYGLLEGVSHITGTAIPAIFEWCKNKRLTILGDLSPKDLMSDEWFRSLPKEHLQKLKQIHAKHDSGDAISLAEILYVASLTVANIDKDITRLISIPLDNYDWISEIYAREVVNTLDSIPRPGNIPRAVKFEESLHRTFGDIAVAGGPTAPQEVKGMTLKGVMDICRFRKEGQHIVWEIKHMDTMQPENLLQVVLYMLLLQQDSSAYLVSARTGQTVQVVPKTSTSLLEILQILVSAKSGGPSSRLLNDYSDEEFMNEAKEEFQNLVGKCALPSWFSMKPQRSRFQTRRRKAVASS